MSYWDKDYSNFKIAPSSKDTCGTCYQFRNRMAQIDRRQRTVDHGGTGEGDEDANISNGDFIGIEVTGGGGGGVQNDESEGEDQSVQSEITIPQTDVITTTSTSSLNNGIMRYARA